jgi:hypothetical protein
MAEAGFTRGGEGIPGGRFSGEIQTTSGADNEPEAAIMADGFRRNGFDVRENVLSNVLAQDNQLRASFPTMSTANTNMGIRGMLYLVSDDIPSPANR